MPSSSVGPHFQPGATVLTLIPSGPSFHREVVGADGEGRLAHPVGKLHHAFHWSGGRDRPHHHDRAAAGLLQERHRELGQLQRALDVDVRDGGPIVEVAVEEPADRRVERRDVHQPVEPAEGRSRAADTISWQAERERMSASSAIAPASSASISPSIVCSRSPSRSPSTTRAPAATA